MAPASPGIPRFLARSAPRRAAAGVLLIGLLGGLFPASLAAHPSDHAQLMVVDARLRAHPDDPALLRLRADLLRLEGEFDAAARALDLAERAAPGDPRQRALRARLNLDRDDPIRALDEANAVIAAVPGDAEGWLLRAECLARRGAHAAAGRALDQAIGRMATPRPDVYLARARAFRAAGNPDRALAGLDAARERWGPLTVLESEAAGIELERGHVDAALARLDGLAGQYERRDAFLARRGDLLQRAGRLPAAMAAWSEALALIDARTPALAGDARDAGALRARLEAAAAVLERGR